MRRALALLVGALSLLAAAPAWAEVKPSWEYGQQVDAEPDALVTSGLARAPGATAPAPVAAATGPRPVFAYAYEPAQCAPEHPGCPVCPDPTASPVVVRVTNLASGESHYQRGITCLAPAQQTPLDPAQAEPLVASYLRRVPLPLPALRTAPADHAIVNLPSIVWTEPPAQTTFAVEEPPFPPITISARVHWRWDFGDGSVLTTRDPGRPYDGTDPAARPEHYVDHTYAAPHPGRTISVTAVWTATYTVTGYPGTYAVGGTVERTTTATMPVDEYHAVLVGS